MPPAPSAQPRPAHSAPRYQQGELRFDRGAADEALLARMPEWMRPDQVAKVLGRCSTEHVRILRHAGKLEARDFRTPGAGHACWRFYRESVRAYLASCPTAAHAG